MSAERCVLLIDDDADHRFIEMRVLQKIVKGKPVRLVEAETGVQGLASLAKLVDDGFRVLLITDFRMPQMSGPQVIKEARSRHPKAPIRYVLLTSFEQLPEMLGGEPAADEVVSKPFDQREFQALFESLVEKWANASPRAKSA